MGEKLFHFHDASLLVIVLTIEPIHKTVKLALPFWHIAPLLGKLPQGDISLASEKFLVLVLRGSRHIGEPGRPRAPQCSDMPHA